MSNVADALNRLTPEQRAIIEKKLQQKRALAERAAPAESKIQPRPSESGYPLSAGQERLFRLAQFVPDATAYNITEAVRLHGELDLAALKQGIAQVVERHESLRARFAEVDGEICQSIAPFGAVALNVQHVSLTNDDEVLNEINRFIHAEQSQPFDLHEGPLYRVKVVVLAPDEHILILTMHHIIADAWSFSVLFKELSQNYAASLTGEQADVEPLPIQYADFAHWQKAWIAGPQAQKQLDYWKGILTPGVEPLQLPQLPAQSRLTESERSGDVVEKIVEPSLVEALQSASRDAGVTLFVTLLAGFKATLHRYTAQTDMVVCSPTVGRKQVETEAQIGYFNNIVAIRTDLSGNPDMNQAQERVQQSLIAAYDHDEIPFQQVASLPHLARVQLTRALFTLQDGLNEALSLPNINVEPIAVESLTSDFDVSLYMEWSANNLVASLEFKTAIIDHGSAEKLLDDLCDTLQLIAADPMTSLQSLPHIGASNSAESHNAIHHGTASTFTNGSVPELQPSTPINSQIEPNGLGKRVDENQPPNELEAELIQIWEEVLGLEGIHRTDNFFDLGGHSMSALRLFTQIEKELTQEKLPLALLLQAPTVAEMAQALRGDKMQAAWSLVVPLQEKGNKPPLFCIHAAGGNVLLYNDLAHHLSEWDQPVFGIQSQGLDGTKPILKSVEEMAEVYVKEILAVQPTGPFMLAGYCLGGTVAVDVAQRLMAEGHHVAFLGLMETYNWANLKDPSMLSGIVYQSQRAEFMIRNFMMLDSEQRQEFLRGKMDRVQGRTSVWRGALQSMLRSTPAVDNTKNEDAILAELWESNDAAADAYVPRSYPGKITHFIPAKDYAEYDDPSLMWDNIAEGGVDVHKLSVFPAGMVYEPFVGTLAKHIRDCIDLALERQTVS